MGLTMGRSLLDETWVDEHARTDQVAGTASISDTLSLTSVFLEVLMLLICVRDLWYDLSVL